MRHRDKKGFTISELLLVFIIVILVGALMMPFIYHIRANMDSTVCINNLRHIGLALYIYAREHGGRFPETFKTLYDQKYLADEKLADCPASKSTGTPEDPDYIYTAGLSVRGPVRKALLRDKVRNHPGDVRNVLYVNGTVAGER